MRGSCREVATLKSLTASKMESTPEPTEKPKRSLKEDANILRGKSQSYNVPGELPIYLKALSEFGDITWVCGVNEDGVIRGITRCQGSNEYQVIEFASKEEALAMKEELMGEPEPGCVKFYEVANAELVFQQKNSDGQVVAPNRKQARRAAKKLREGKMKK